MNRNSSQKSALTLLSVLTAIISTTFLISIVARGYIPQYDNGLKITATGLLSASSLPKNASVFINDKLYDTTDSTINLVPSDYQLKITKDGYLPWNKKITIQKEMVYQAQASLFRTNPVLTPITTDGVISPTVSPDLSELIYISSPSTSSVKPGIYLIDNSYYLTLVPIKFQAKLLVPNPFPSTDKSITFTFSPNSKQVIVKSAQKRNIYLIDLTTNDTQPKLTEIIQPNEKIAQDWLTQTKQLESISVNKLPKVFTATISTNPSSITFSSDENKFMYKIDKRYFTYDIEKNISYFIGNQDILKSPFWLPKSNTIIYSESGKIKSIEFDGTNSNTIFSNNFHSQTQAPQFDGEKIIISTTTDTNPQENIYTLTIR